MSALSGPLAVLVGTDDTTMAMIRFILEDIGCTVLDVAKPEAIDSETGTAQIALVIVVVDRHQTSLPTGLVKLRGAMPGTPLLLIARRFSDDMRRGATQLRGETILFPIDARELRQRLYKALGANAPAPLFHAAIIRAGGLTLSHATREVVGAAGRRVTLTRREADLLHALMRKPGHSVAHQELLDTLWSDEAQGAPNALAVYVRRLRIKLAQLGANDYIHTDAGSYRFDARSQPRAEPPAALAPRGALILVVDDDHATVELITEILQTAGYSVLYSDSVQSVAQARITAPALILLDINMPQMDGIEVRRHLRQHPQTAGIPIIAMSAVYNLRKRGAEMGADDFLPKPFSVDELLLRVDKWISR